MGHGITKTDQMMYVGETPWHSLGNPFPGEGLATRTEALQLANMLWKVGKKRIMTVDGTLIDDRYATYREDTDEVLGVVGERYQIYQNDEAFAFFDEITQDPHGPKYVTAGSLMGGAVVWMLAKLPTIIKVSKLDILEEYLLLTHGHDGRHKFDIMYTPTRVVCWNTLTLATDGARREQRIRFKHIGSLMSKVTAAQDVLGIVRQNANNMSEVAQMLVHKQVTQQDVDEYVKKLFPAKDEQKVHGRVENLRTEIKRLFEEGKGNDDPETRGTVWPLYNAVTEYVDHERSDRSLKHMSAEERRFKDVLFGVGADIKAEALEEAIKLAKV